MREIRWGKRTVKKHKWEARGSGRELDSALKHIPVGLDRLLVKVHQTVILLLKNSVRFGSPMDYPAWLSNLISLQNRSKFLQCPCFKSSGGRRVV